MKVSLPTSSRQVRIISYGPVNVPHLMGRQFQSCCWIRLDISYLLFSCGALFQSSGNNQACRGSPKGSSYHVAAKRPHRRFRSTFSGSSEATVTLRSSVSALFHTRRDSSSTFLTPLTDLLSAKEPESLLTSAYVHHFENSGLDIYNRLDLSEFERGRIQRRS